MNRRDVLIKARDAIKQYGWLQGEVGNKESGFCAWGAIAHAGGRGTIARGAKHALDKVAGGSVINYNDAPGRSKASVLRLFGRGIRSLS